MSTSLFSDYRIRGAHLRSVAAALVLGLASMGAQAQVAAFTAVLQPTQEVPPILTSTAFGNAFMTFTPSDMMLCYSITYGDVVTGMANLASGETVAHFHGPAAPGVGGGVLFNISPVPSPTGSPKVGCVGPLSVAQRTDLVNGLWYINIHSNDFGGGELRGQVLLGGVIR